MTPLDHAHAAMAAAPDDTTARLGFFNCLGATELYLLLVEEPKDSVVTPMEFPLEDHPCVLVFDSAERLVAFTEKPSAYVALSGRSVVGMLKDQTMGLGVNLSVAPSSILIPPHAVAWLAQMLEANIDEVSKRPETITAPKDISQNLLTALDQKLATAAGMAKCAFLVGVTYQDQVACNLLAIVDPETGAHEALKQAIHEALVFTPDDGAKLDIGFFKASDPLCMDFAKFGLRFDLPELVQDQSPSQPKAPGMDPDNPPIL